MPVRKLQGQGGGEGRISAHAHTAYFNGAKTYEPPHTPYPPIVNHPYGEVIVKLFRERKQTSP